MENRGEIDQVLKVNFWLPFLVCVVSSALAAGIAYGIMGGDISRNAAESLRNANDIAGIKSQNADFGTMTVNIRLDLVKASGERKGLKTQLNYLTDRLDKQWGALPGG